MPIRVPHQLPAVEILQKENIFVMDDLRAKTQDIRELKIVILNLMPIKQETEVQLLRLLGNTPLQVDVTLMRPITHESKNTSKQYLENFYKTFDEVKKESFDGMIITGAPVEQMAFEEVTYWDELTEIMAWSKVHVTSTLHICWGAQAGLYYHHGVDKQTLPKKQFGIFEHHQVQQGSILKGLDDVVYIPHSRHTGITREDIYRCQELMIHLDSKEAGVSLIATKDGKQVFATGHAEYDSWTLNNEYERDFEKGLPIEIPCNYYKDDDQTKEPIVRWRSHANVIFSNWLNYYVYQVTPFNLSNIH